MRNATARGVSALLIFVCAASHGRAETISLENVPPATVVSEVFGDQGSGPIRIRGTNRRFPEGVNAAVIFDSANPTGEDEDLGTPHRDFGGPGEGDGGRRGSRFENNAARGHLLIVNENQVVVPDDEGWFENNRLRFDFSALGTVTISEITVVDPEEGGSVEFFDPEGGRIGDRVSFPLTGNNGVWTERFPSPITGVAAMEVTLVGSGGVDIVEFSASETPPPGIDIQKATNGADADRADGADVPRLEPGAPVEWTYVVTNTGGVELTGIEVVDDRGVAVSCPNASLAPGARMTCRATGVAADLAAGGMETVSGTCGGEGDRPLYRNLGRVSGRAPDGTSVTDRDPSHYCNGCRPSVEVRKRQITAADPSASGLVFEIEVENTGCGELRNLVVTDALASACGREIERLAPGESTSYRCQATLSNEVCVAATTAGGQPVTRDCAAVAIEGCGLDGDGVRAPSLIGLKRSAAVKILDELGLQHVTRTHWSLFGGNRVARQRPAPCEPVPEGGEVELEVAGAGGCLPWLLALLLLLLLAGLLWYLLRWRRRDRVVLVGDKSPGGMALHRKDCTLLERVEMEDRVEIEGSRADERAIYRRGKPVALVREWQARGFGLCAQCLPSADSTGLLVGRLTQLQELVSDRFGTTSRSLSDLEKLLSERVSTTDEGLRDSVARLRDLVSDRLVATNESVGELQALVSQRTSATSDHLRETLGQLQRELSERDAEATRRISELQQLVSERASMTIEQLRERVARLQTEVSERDTRAAERIAELQALVSERSLSSTREIAELQKLVSERASSKREIAELQQLVSERSSSSTREIVELQKVGLERSSATMERVTERIGALQKLVAEQSSTTMERVAERIGTLQKLVAEHSSTAADRVLVRIAELQQLITDREAAKTDRLLAKITELQEFVAKRSSATTEDLGGRLAELRLLVLERDSAAARRLEELLAKWCSQTTVSEAAPKRKSKKKRVSRRRGRLLLVANTRSKELHRRDCRYAGRVSARNREEIAGTAGQEVSFYERGEVPRALIARWMGRGYNGCAFCLEEFNVETGRRSARVGSARRRGGEETTETVETETVEVVRESGGARRGSSRDESGEAE